MASLMDELFDALSSEKEIYEKLIPVSEKKTGILVRGELKALEGVTREEQDLLEQANVIGNKRESIIQNIGLVLNKDPKLLDLATLTELLGKQPEEKQKLAGLHDELKSVMKRLVSVNEKNKDLIENSLEMVEFNMNFIQSTRMSPGVNNYDRNASSKYSPGYTPGGFDAKQ